jgi:outer membrane immunogenic protein
MLKHIGAAAGLLSIALVSASGANAGDGSHSPSVNWTGFYIGGDAGYAWNSADFSIAQTGAWVGEPLVDLAAATDGGLDLNGATFGGQLGYNQQQGRWVWGIEGDVVSLSAEASRLGGAISGTSIGIFSQRAEASWMASIRGRVGMTFDRVLFYGTAGVAFADWDVEMQMDSIGAVAVFRESSVRTGWIVGGGIALALDRNWSVNGEYLFADFGSIKGTSEFPPPALPNFTHDHKVKLETQILRAGLNYRF